MASLLPNKLNMIVVWLFLIEMIYEIMRTSAVASKSKNGLKCRLRFRKKILRHNRTRCDTLEVASHQHLLTIDELLPILYIHQSIWSRSIIDNIMNSRTLALLLATSIKATGSVFTTSSTFIVSSRYQVGSSIAALQLQTGKMISMRYYYMILICCDMISHVWVSDSLHIYISCAHISCLISRPF